MCCHIFRDQVFITDFYNVNCNIMKRFSVAKKELTLRIDFWGRMDSPPAIYNINNSIE